MLWCWNYDLQSDIFFLLNSSCVVVENKVIRLRNKVALVLRPLRLAQRTCPVHSSIGRLNIFLAKEIYMGPLSMLWHSICCIGYHWSIFHGELLWFTAQIVKLSLYCYYRDDNRLKCLVITYTLLLLRFLSLLTFLIHAHLVLLLFHTYTYNIITHRLEKQFYLEKPYNQQRSHTTNREATQTTEKPRNQ